MASVGWMVLAALVVGGVAVWLRQRYPGGWRYALSTEYAGQRRDLDAARGRLRELRREAERALAAARAGVDAAERARRSRIAQAETHLARLRSPGRGMLRSSVGRVLWLYEHVLVVEVDGREIECPLPEVSVRDEYSDGIGHVYVALPDGRREMVSVSLEEVPEAEVRRFVVEVFNASADEKIARAERQARVPQAEAELRAAEADTAGQDRARDRMAEVEAGQKSDKRIPRARQELDAAFDRWEQLTGHRPQ
ncbi:hypothetical protein [Streptomyces sp. 1331.2]|uniref:hypothetical protein n=1 Tax=Streptomyces sp. 1331.2 TaxID=1938835 RepID=UPI000BD6DE43|nr:hypothetical protein [Streptomyces sp. 1331.2]SOB88662.1 hypothetical protein SAMN06272789_6952 [Streptomyces sp. 1331.2]